MDWNNINLNSPFEASQEILDGYSFDNLLLEVSCNLPVINRDTVKAQAMESIKIKYQTALSILAANLDNIVNYAISEREK